MTAVRDIVIVGGGTAGWLTAGLIAAEHNARDSAGLRVTLVESPDIPIIGVGEGTWPSMRNTLRKIGVAETDLFRECDASFKQGAKFARWVNGQANDFYYHPLVIPEGYGDIDLASLWLAMHSHEAFADAINFQSHLCERGLAPKQITTPEYAAVANYAYHLNAGKLSHFLQRHCTEKLGVQYVLATVQSIRCHDNGDIAAVVTRERGDISGDLFVDCSGLSALLISQHYGIPFIDCKDQLFNDRALATQVPYTTENAPIASHTISTAQSAGWIWDIGLPTRKGIGYVYSSAHIRDEQVERELKAYITQSLPAERVAELSFRRIDFRPGHRERFWHKNCVAMGMAAGFLEPLEASALVLVELGAGMIADDMPATRSAMAVVAKRYNERFRYRWNSIIDFLKLHYALSQRRDSAYWCDNVNPETFSPRLREWLTLWRDQPPCRFDFPQMEEVFASASWQYVLYGMGFKTTHRVTTRRTHDQKKYQLLYEQNRHWVQRCLQSLPSNRELIEKIKQFGLQTV